MKCQIYFTFSDFPDFPDSPQIFQSMDFSADFPQLYRIRRFSRFSILRKFSADFPRQVFQIFRQIFRFTGSARFSADFSACQIFRQSASKSSFPHKKRTGFFQSLPIISDKLLKLYIRLWFFPRCLQPYNHILP